METQIQQCKSCEALLSGPFCSQCGQKLIIDRLTTRGVFKKGIQSLFNFELGLWYTIRMLFVNPGLVVEDYIKGKTKPYYNPFRYALISVALSAFLVLGLNVFEGQVDQVLEIYKNYGLFQSEEHEAMTRKSMGWMTKL